MIKIGRLFSMMVFQNIAALMVVGIIRALFGVYGWWPNDRILLMLNPMLNLLIPVLIGYTGGRILGGQRAGVVAAVVTMGIALASSVPMIIGAMIVGALIGWLVRKIDKILENRLPIGFELLVANFIYAVLAVVLTIISFLYIGQALSSGIIWLNKVMESIINSGLLPLASIIIEPAKVFFFNNVMSQGMLSPLGIHQVKNFGKSVFFLLETNPGPGIGLMLAWLLKSQGKQRKIARATLVIHSLGGIHEVYFPYVLMNPRLLLAVVTGGMTGIAIFQYMDVGLVAIPSPPSIVLLAALAPRDDIMAVLLGIAGSSLVSFMTAYLLIKSNAELPLMDMNIKNWEDLDGRREESDTDIPLFSMGKLLSKERMPTEEQRLLESKKQRNIQTIVFACDAGIYSSAMGAALLRKKLKEAGLKIIVKNSSVDRIPRDADLIITQKYLMQRAMESAPNAEHISITSYIDSTNYDVIISRLKTANEGVEELPTQEGKSNLIEEQILLGCRADSPKTAIEIIGQRMVELGYVRDEYIEEMLQREQSMSTYLGNNVAIPHGLDGESRFILRPGIVIAQFPEGVRFNDELVHLLIGIAGYEQRQVNLLSSIVRVIEDHSRIKPTFSTRSKKEMINAFLLLGNEEGTSSDPM
jgi:PTS system mannitol-specific IIC component